MSVSPQALFYTQLRLSEGKDMTFRHNDYEIIALIKEGNDEALNLMVTKYRRFIAKKIHQFNLEYHFEDLMQEGIIVLYRSVITFNPIYNKTFTRYLEMNLKRHMMTTIQKFKRYSEVKYFHEEIIAENTLCLHESSEYYELHLNEIKPILSLLEYQVYMLREQKNYSIEAIAKMLEQSEKTIYNALHRAKSKIHAFFKD